MDRRVAKDPQPPMSDPAAVRVPPAITHQVNVCRRLHAVKTPAIPGQTGLGAMRVSHRHVSDDALAASSEPIDAGATASIDTGDHRSASRPTSTPAGRAVRSRLPGRPVRPLILGPHPPR